jgi:N-acetylmuramoyl-L-alanine amidase
LKIRLFVLIALALAYCLCAADPTPAPPAKPAATRTPAPSTPINFPYTPAVRPDGRHVVALDIGHTLAQHGSTSARGKGEFEFNQRIVRQLFARLEKSRVAAPFIINPEGGKIGLLDRPKIAAEKGAELFLSIHHDAALEKYLLTWEPAGDGVKQFYCDQFRGYGVFMSMKNRQADRSLAFTQMLGAAMRGQGFVFARHHAEPVQGENRPIIDEARGVYQYDDLIVLKHAPMPAALLECGVIINRVEELELEKPETQARIVEAVAGAVELFFGGPVTGK